MRMIRCLISSVALLIGSSAAAVDPVQPTDPGEFPLLEVIREIPDYSYELAVHMSYGELPYWKTTYPTWIGFGIRGGWGKHWGIHRIGFDVAFMAEGPFGVQGSIGLEPHATWNMVTSRGLLLGGGLGVANMVHMSAGPSQYVKGETHFGVAPSAAIRAGWSQTWSSMERRIFVLVEPRVRIVNVDPGFGASLVIGSGAGR